MTAYTDVSRMTFVLKVTCYNIAEEALETYLFKESLAYKSGTSFFRPLNQVKDQSSISIDRSAPFYDEGRGNDGIGTVIINNSSNNWNFLLNSYLNKLPIEFYLGQHDWAFEDFNFITTCLVSRVDKGEKTIEFTLEPANYALNKLIINEKLENGDVKPIAVGYVQNCPGVIISSNVDFQYNSIQQTQLIYVMDKGVNSTAYTDISSGSDKKVHMNSNPVGNITFEFKSGQRGGSYVEKPGVIAAYLAERAGLTVHEASITALDALKPFQMGIFSKGQINYLDALDEVLGSVGGFYFLDFDNKFRVNCIQTPSSLTSVLTLSNRANLLSSVEVSQYSKPCYQLSLEYDKNFNVFSENDLAGRITGSAMQFFTKEYRTVSYTDETIIPTIEGVKQYQFFDTRTFKPSLIISSSDATTELQARWAIFSKHVYFVTFRALVEPFSLLPGDGVTLQFSLNELLQNTKAQILSLKYYSYSLCEVKCFILV